MTNNMTIYDREQEALDDPSIPLGYPRAARTELGPSILAFYREKHARGQAGSYYPLHLTANPKRP
jgi:hypothetical protein